MTVLVVAERVPDADEAALQVEDWNRVDDTSAAVRVVEDEAPAALVLVAGSFDPGPVVEAARSADDVVPVVAVGEEGVPAPRAVDATVERSVETDRLREAVERALLISDYDGAVARLFDRAKERSSDADGPPASSPELRRLRREADAALSELVALDDPELLAALVEERGLPGVEPGDG